MKTVSTQLLNDLTIWLGPNGIAFFSACVKQYGDVSPVMSMAEADRIMDPESVGLSPKFDRIPHPVHFREGMQVRNWMRGQDECKDWTDHDFDDNWKPLVTRIIVSRIFGAP